MSEPNFPPGLLQRLFSLKTPVTERLYELLLTFIIIGALSFISEHSSQSAVKFAMGIVMPVLLLVAFALAVAVLVALFGNLDNKEK